MKTLHKTLTFIPSDLFPKDAFFVDIETTGLSKYTHFIFCIGLIYRKENSLKQIQWMICSQEEEAHLLQTFIEFISPFTTSYTYGGLHFERSFLIERFLFHFSCAQALESIKWHDLSRFPFIRNFFPKKRIKRRTLETHLKIKRTLSITGKEVVKLFTLYQQNKEATNYEEILLKHNEEELTSLLSIYLFLTSLQKKLKKENHFSVSRKENEIILSVHMPEGEAFSFELEGIRGIKIIQSQTHFSLSLPIYTGHFYSFIEDYKNYEYLPERQEIIHKSLASLIPKAARRKAKKEECILKKEGNFIPLPFNAFSSRIWLDDQKQKYIAEEDLFKENRTTNYLQALQKILF